MLSLSKIRKDKRGLSNLIGYVLLVALAIVLAALIYNWSKDVARDRSVATCSEKIGIAIDDYECIPGAAGNISITLRNKGLFDFDGFDLRINNKAGAHFGNYVLNDSGVALSPGESVTLFYDFGSIGFENVTLIDTQPFVREGLQVVDCGEYISQIVDCRPDSYCGDGVTDYFLFEACDDGNNVDGDGCSASCLGETVYSGYTLGETFYDLYLAGKVNPINSGPPTQANCDAVDGDCYIFKYYSSLEVDTPPILFEATYNVTFESEFEDYQDNENFEIRCGTTSKSFMDYNLINGFVNLSVLCNFTVGVNNITFETLPSTAGSIHFWKLEIEGPILV